MPNAPKGGLSRQIASRARAIVHYKFNAERWEYREQTGMDYGLDCRLELLRDDYFNSDFIEVQIKGVTSPQFLKSGKELRFQMEKKTIVYALNSANAFVLLLVDVPNETIYYLPLQDYFISDPTRFDALNSKYETMAIHIPVDNIVSDQDDDLQAIAQSRYIHGPGKELKKIS